MKNELMIFENEEFGKVGMIEIDGKPYFVANDIARALGYASPKNAISRHCKGGTETVLPYRRWRTGSKNYSRGRYVPFNHSKQIRDRAAF